MLEACRLRQHLVLAAHTLLDSRIRSRDEAIRRAIASGYTEREVARATGLARSLIHRINTTSSAR